MKRIKKHYDSIKQAESYQSRLYNKYDHVRLVSFPLSGEAGDYIWEVK